MKKYGGLLLVFMMCYWLSACSHTAKANLDLTKGAQQHVEYYGLQIQQSVKVIAMRQKRVNNLLQASADVQNTKQKDAAFQYKFRFYDKDGFEVGNETRPWTPITLVSKDTATLQAIAPNEKATQFTLIISN